MFSTQYVALQDMGPDLQQYKTCTIAKAMGWVHIPEEHQGATKLDMEVSKGKARDIEGVQIFNGITFLVAFDFVNADQCELGLEAIASHGSYDSFSSSFPTYLSTAVVTILIYFYFPTYVLLITYVLHLTSLTVLFHETS